MFEKNMDSAEFNVSEYIVNMQAMYELQTFMREFKTMQGNNQVKLRLQLKI
jgi:hypothetical protein